MAPSVGPHIGVCIGPFIGGGVGLEEAKEGRVKVGGRGKKASKLGVHA